MTEQTDAVDPGGVSSAQETLGPTSDLLLRDTRSTIAALQEQVAGYQTAIDNIIQGVCIFDRENRLAICNRRYAEIYRLAHERLAPGTSLAALTKLHIEADTTPTDALDYLSWCASPGTCAGQKTWTTALKDGRTIRIDYRVVPSGGWVVAHEEISAQRQERDTANTRISLQTLIDWVPDHLWVKDTASRLVVVNKALAAGHGRLRTSELIGLSDFDLHPEEAAGYRALEQEILRTGQPMIDREELVVYPSGVTKWLLSTKVPLFDDQNKIFGLVGIARDITSRKQADALRDGQAGILEMIAKSSPLETVLDGILRLVESQLTGISGSILLLDEDGLHLRHGAAPSMAPTYTAAFVGITIGPNAASCGTAVYHREPIVVTDVMHDPLWEDYRELAGQHGYQSCWSTPILSPGTC